MNLYETIYSKVKEIPSGSVASYGEVAKASGLFRGARLVGWALRQMPPNQAIPWQRVVNQKGLISIQNPSHPAEEQKNLLEQEGIGLVWDDGYYRIVNPPWHLF